MSSKQMYNKMFKGYPDVVDIHALRSMLGIGKNTAYKLVNSGKIVCKREGNKIIIPKVSVIQYLLS